MDSIVAQSMRLETNTISHGNDSGLINRSSILMGDLGLPIHSYETAPVVVSLVILISAYSMFGFSMLDC